MDLSRSRALRELLLELLTEAELRALLHDLHGRGLSSALPSATPAEVFFAAVDALDRRGLVTERLFTSLAEHAPGKRRRIAEVAALWGLAPEQSLSTESAGAVIEALEGVHGLLCARDMAAALAFVCDRQAVFFPSSGSVDHEGRTEHTLSLHPERALLSVERVTFTRWTSGLIVCNCYAVLGLDVELLQATPGGWVLADDCVAQIDAMVAACPSRLSGAVHVFVGSRAQLAEHGRVAAWTAAKGHYAASRVSVRTTEGLIDTLATEVLGARWFTQVPPGSTLARPLV